MQPNCFSSFPGASSCGTPHLCLSDPHKCFQVPDSLRKPVSSFGLPSPQPAPCSWVTLPPSSTLSHGPQACFLAPAPDPASVPSAMTCPANTVYQSCMTPCPATCANLAAPGECEGPCVEGCASLPGYAYSGIQSLPLASCGCTTNGIYYQVWAGGGRRRGVEVLTKPEPHQPGPSFLAG